MANKQTDSRVRYVPGHKTDQKDSAWICKLLRAGLLKGGFVSD